MSIKAFIRREWWYTPKRELATNKDGSPVTPEAQRAAYLLGVPDATGLAALEDVGNVISAGPLGEQVMRRPNGTIQLLALRGGLRGWRNHMGPDGQPAEFEKLEAGACPMENIELLDPKLRDELAARILEGMALTEDERKN